MKTKKTATVDFDAEFDKEFHYNGNDLGAVPTQTGTAFRLWAPTATAVRLQLFSDGVKGAPDRIVEMQQGEQGTWFSELPCGSGTYYTYLVTVNGKTRETVDPYAKAAGANGHRGMVIASSTTDPAGFRETKPIRRLQSYRDAVIWEIHVRDFSVSLPGTAYPGKYLAFTERGLENQMGIPVGVDYLSTLGITHVHLQPVFDFGSVDECNPEKSYNWGYDPVNYFVPEGSYSTNPEDGACRIRELKQLVQSLHEQGIGVIFDMVFNHTYRKDSCLERTVPGYYYRKTPEGKWSNGSGCGNETASERSMMRKYMVDCVGYWAEEYLADGFRFDLMALHDLETMQAIERAVHRVNPNAILYGEGWTGGTSALSPDRQTSLSNVHLITPAENTAGGIAVFNDAIRDGLKGSVFQASAPGWINGSPDMEAAEKVCFGIGGGKEPGMGWQVHRGEVINYMSAHDNATLWDKLSTTCSNATAAERLAMNRLGASVVLLSEGIPFFLGGEELLRTKQGDTNSYASSDEINHFDWESLKPGTPASEMSLFYARLIALRRATPFLREAEVSCIIEKPTLLKAEYFQNGRLVGAAWFNALPHAEKVEVAHGALQLWNGDRALREPVRGFVTVPARAAVLLRIL